MKIEYRLKLSKEGDKYTALMEWKGRDGTHESEPYETTHYIRFVEKVYNKWRYARTHGTVKVDYINGFNELDKSTMKAILRILKRKRISRR